MGYHFLIVDDSMLTRAAIKRIIAMIDIEPDKVYEASNGREALDIMQKEHVDLVLADLNMPEMTGVEMVHHMKEMQDLSDIPVMVVSTESSSARIEDLLAEGVSGFLHKPFTPEEFREKLSETLGVTHD